VCDDQFMRNLATVWYPEIKTSNGTAMFEVLLSKNPDSFLDIMVTLTKVEYHQCYSEHLILAMINIITQHPIILAEGTRIYKFRMILRNLLSASDIFTQVIHTLRNIISDLYANRINLRNEMMISTIIKEIKIASLKLREVDDDALIKFLVETYEIDVIKAEYIERLYNETIKNLHI